MAPSFFLSLERSSTYFPEYASGVRTPCGLAENHFDQPCPWLLLAVIVIQKKGISDRL